LTTYSTSLITYASRTNGSQTIEYGFIWMSAATYTQFSILELSGDPLGLIQTKVTHSMKKG